MSTESGNGIQVHLSVTFLLKNNFPITIIGEGVILDSFPITHTISTLNLQEQIKKLRITKEIFKEITFIFEQIILTHIKSANVFYTRKTPQR